MLVQFAWATEQLWKFDLNSKDERSRHHWIGATTVGWKQKSSFGTFWVDATLAPSSSPLRPVWFLPGAPLDHLVQPMVQPTSRDLCCVGCIERGALKPECTEWCLFVDLLPARRGSRCTAYFCLSQPLSSTSVWRISTSRYVNTFTKLFFLLGHDYVKHQNAVKQNPHHIAVASKRRSLCQHKKWAGGNDNLPPIDFSLTK